MGSIEERPFRPEYDVLVIGCGLSGIYTLYRMQQLGLKVKALDAGSGEGGTWFWSVDNTLGRLKLTDHQESISWLPLRF